MPLFSVSIHLPGVRSASPFGRPASRVHGTTAHSCSLRTWGQDSPEAHAVAVVRVVVGAKGNPAAEGVVVPTAAA